MNQQLGRPAGCMGVTVVTAAGFQKVMLRDAVKTLRLNRLQPIHNPQRPLPTTLGMALKLLYYHSNKCWVKNNPSWVKHGQTKLLGCFDRAVGLND